MNELFPRPTKTAMNELFPRPTKTAVGGLRKFKTKNEKCKVQFFEQFLFSHFWFMIKLLRDRLMVVASSATRRRGGGNMFYAYIFKSKNNGRLYVGSTDNLKRRFKEHNQGIGGNYTKNNKPFELVFYEAYLSYDLARKAEEFYKTGYGREVLKSKLKI